MKLISTIIATLLCIPALAAAIEDVEESGFQKQVLPFLTRYCTDCHGGDRPKAKFDLTGFQNTASVISGHGHWEHVLDRLKAGDMPPEDSPQPSANERSQIITWIETRWRIEAERNAGDPGIVLARRLSNAEYDYTIRDLTGVDLRPTREFPIDPANEAGFDNSGESLTLSPALLKKYLGAARSISEHLVLTTDGLEFAPHPVITDTDRDKFCVKRIIAFYQRQEIDLAEYFFASWQRRHDQSPTNKKISTRYLRTILDLLEGHDHNLGPIAALRTAWRNLPPPDQNNVAEIEKSCAQLRDQIETLRTPLSPEFQHLTFGRIIHSGAQAFVYWRNRQYANSRRTLNRDALDLQSLPIAERNQIIAAHEKFCSVFPNVFYRSERVREYVKDFEKNKTTEKGRLLSAGLHSQLGYFRDDTPLSQLILTAPEQRQLDKLWLELDVVASAAIRQHRGMVWFERTDSPYMRDEQFDFARPEHHDLVSEAKIRRLEKVYLKKAMENGADEKIVIAINEHFEIVNQNIRRLERARTAAEPGQLRALVEFATRAYRRPLANSEHDEFLAFYQDLRTTGEASHEDALRDLVVSVLMSAHFWYRVDTPAIGDGVHPLADHAFASRLSYFLWSSMPDAELLAAASKGKLNETKSLRHQVRRMIKDDRIRALAIEFGGNWLEFRHFENHNSVDRERFPNFDSDLRQAMYEEPIRFIVDLAQANRSILDSLHSEHTFVNPSLANHYGLPAADGWQRVKASAVQRGGLLPMAIFQTANAGGLRTSPVKRGYWVVRRLLGEHIPPPPPAVPELPEDEGIGTLSLREQLARHREDPNCRACHDRFDSIGLAFEGYGPIGELRTLDLGGRPVENHASFPAGGTGHGLNGLRNYLGNHRQDEFVENLCRKLFSYALGRKLILSDNPTIATMKTELAKNNYRFGTLIESIVNSRQFRFQRGRLVSKK
jgi:hypothetical protein